jgi:hypothetical protein
VVEDLLGDLGGDVGVVLAVAVAEVRDLVAAVPEVGGQALLQGGAGVVGTDGDGRYGPPLT